MESLLVLQGKVNSVQYQTLQSYALGKTPLRGKGDIPLVGLLEGKLVPAKEDGEPTPVEYFHDVTLTLLGPERLSEEQRENVGSTVEDILLIMGLSVRHEGDLLGRMIFYSEVLIDYLGLDVRSYNVLKWGDKSTIGEVLRVLKEEPVKGLSSIRGIGKKTESRIKEALTEYADKREAPNNKI